MAFPGAIAVWSGTQPRFETYRIPPHADGLVLGREIADPSDDRISRAHVRLTIEDDRVWIGDLNSRNGTFVEGDTLRERRTLTEPTVVRAGRSVFVVMPEIRPYEHVPISRRGSLVVGGTLDAACRVVDTAAVEAENLAIVGPRSVGLELARSYAKALGGEYAVFDTAVPVSAENVISAAPKLRTLLLELGRRALLREDALAICELLETDVRFVTRVQAEIDLANLPPSIASRLTSRVLELPKVRYDELPTTLHDIVCELAPSATIHATAIEMSLLMLRSLDEDRLLDQFRADVRRWLDGGFEQARGLRGEHVFVATSNPAHWCLHGFEVPRRRR